LRGISTVLLLTVISAEETVITSSGRRAIVPYVGYASPCNEFCLFKSETEIGKYNKFCMKGAPPAVRIGWGFGQRYATSEVQKIGNTTVGAIKFY